MVYDRARPQILRSSHYLMLHSSEAVQDTGIVKTVLTGTDTHPTQGSHYE